MKQETVVEWLQWALVNTILTHEQVMQTIGLFEQAKDMFEEQITKAFDEGQEYEYQYHINSTPKFDSETYYNETFKSK